MISEKGNKDIIWNVKTATASDLYRWTFISDSIKKIIQKPKKINSNLSNSMNPILSSAIKKFQTVKLSIRDNLNLRGKLLVQGIKMVTMYTNFIDLAWAVILKTISLLAQIRKKC